MYAVLFLNFVYVRVVRQYHSIDTRKQHTSFLSGGQQTHLGVECNHRFAIDIIVCLDSHFSKPRKILGKNKLLLIRMCGRSPFVYHDMQGYFVTFKKGIWLLDIYTLLGHLHVYVLFLNKLLRLDKCS